MVGDVQEICEGLGIFMLVNVVFENGIWNGIGIIDNIIGFIDLDSLIFGEIYVYDYCVESDVVVGCFVCVFRFFFII